MFARHFIKHFQRISPRPHHSSPFSSLTKGCDYQHWFILMDSPQGYPNRDEIINTYINTLALGLGSVEEARRSVYSVSTKYYYGFGCRISDQLAQKMQSLPNVKWVLPDSYISGVENDYGGEPYVDGKVAPYEEKYHADWLHCK
ncbi:Multiple organellar RNA editing factor 7 [Ranunculus cassubicifolius]